jgi:preprotein translocase subunit SecG
MGASQSNNVAQAFASVSSKISQNTNANASQVSNITNDITLNNCSILGKNVSITETSKTMQSNVQISKALQNSSISNDIQQSLLQSAASTVGAMGIGYADASNSASMFVNSTSDIVNSLSEICNQYSGANNQFLCDNSTIVADNININLGSDNQFLSSQTLNNSQIANISNKISQKADQKATASVEGLTGLFIAIALIIAALGYSLTKPLDTAASKIIITVVILCILLTIIAFMYINQTPPFFNQNNECLPFELNTCDTECVDLTQSTINTKGIPLRYIYGLTPGESSSKSGANLMQMVISYLGGDKPVNGGYNYNNYQKIQTLMDSYNSEYKYLGIPPLPNLLYVPKLNGSYLVIPDEYLPSGNSLNASICTPSSFIYYDSSLPIEDFSKKCPSRGNLSQTTANPNSYTMANLNYNESSKDDTDWFGYLLNDDVNKTRTKFARYVLCDLLKVIPLSIYIDENELVNVYKDKMHQTGKASDNKEYVYQLQLSTGYDFRSAMNSDLSSKISGKIGVCNDTTYKFHNFMSKIGLWILVFLLVVAIGYMIYSTYKNKKNDENENELVETENITKKK